MTDQTVGADPDQASSEPNPERQTAPPLDLANPPSPNTAAPGATQPLPPPLDHCLSVISASKAVGLDAIPELPALLKAECPELAAILGSSSIKTSLQTYERQDQEAIRQQNELMT